MREKLGAAYYGDELEKIADGTARTLRALHRLLPEAQKLTQSDWSGLGPVLASHFTPRPGIFGGQITAWDGLFIGAFMMAMRPTAMIEIGVASGYSSALILSFAKALGLLRDGSIYLHSFDIVETHANGDVTGSLARTQFADLMPYWSLTIGETSATLDPAALAARLPAGRTLAFVDGGHEHPWPMIDLTFLRRIPQCDWALMQDVQMMERWVGDALIHGWPVPTPVRGAQIAFSHWPHRKITGLDMCYNMAAVDLRIDAAGERVFLEALMPYEAEGLPADQLAACNGYLQRIAAV